MDDDQEKEWSGCTNPARSISEWKHFAATVWCTHYDIGKQQHHVKKMKRGTRHNAFYYSLRDKKQISDIENPTIQPLRRTNWASQKQPKSTMNTQKQKIQIFVKTPLSTTLSINLKLSTQVSILKTIIQDKLGIETGKIQLNYGRLKMSGLLTLGDHGVKHESNILMTICPGLLGGGDRPPDSEEAASNQGASSTVIENLEIISKILTKATTIICDKLIPNDLLRTLQSKEAITDDDADYIRAKITAGDKAEEMLRILKKKPATSYAVLMEALKDKGRGDLQREIEDIEVKLGYVREERELDEQISGTDNLAKIRKVLTKATNIICDNLNPEDILRTLQTKEAITDDDADRIRAEETAGDKAEKLLRILKKKPAKSYDIFMEALKERGRRDLHRRIKAIEVAHGYVIEEEPETKEQMSELVDKIAEELRKHYRGHVCRKHIYPWRKGNRVDFEDIFIPVTIERDVGPGTRPIKESLDSYTELFHIEEDKGHKRYILIGDPGQGKSSLCAKIAYDWCERKTLQDIQLLFIVDLAFVDKATCVEDVVCKLLKDIGVQREQLHHVMQHIKDKLFILLDGFDEAPKDLLRSEDEAETGYDYKVVDVIKDAILKDSRVLVTTRPWRENEVSRIPVYRRLELKKMTKETVKKYVRKFFDLDKENPYLRDKLLDDIEENRILLDMSTPLVILLVCFYCLKTHDTRVPDRLTTLYAKIMDILYNGVDQDFFMKDEIIEHLGYRAAQDLSPYETKIVFKRTQVLESAGERKGRQLLIQAQNMGFVCEKGTDLQFFHKSGQEFFAGAYLGKQSSELRAYLDDMTNIKHALNLGMVLKFATSNSEAAMLVVNKLVAIFQSDAQCGKYYDVEVRDDNSQVNESTPVLTYDEARTVQRLIELILECNYEGACRAAHVQSVFTDGQVLFTGLAQKTSVSLAFFLKENGESIRQINLHPIAHVNDSVNLEEGNMRVKFGQIRASMMTRNDEELDRICTRFQRANTDAWKTVDGLLYNADLASKSHAGKAYVAAYIQCVEESQGLPSLGEVNIKPIIDALPKTNLRVLNCRREYFGKGDNRNYLAKQIANGKIGPKTLSVITELDFGDLTGVNIPPSMSVADFTRLMQYISHMKGLRYLDISRNQVEAGVTLPAFSTSISNCTQLERLNMGLMKGSHSKDIESVLESLVGRSLIELKIGQNPISARAARYLSKCSNLEELGLYWTVETSDGEIKWDVLLQVISSLSKLRELYLHRNKFTKDQLVEIVRICRHDLNDLKKLWVSSNGAYFKDLPEGVSEEDFGDDFITWIKI